MKKKAWDALLGVAAEIGFVGLLILAGLVISFVLAEVGR
jgi:hypothetical protein